jgi:hypothetical protein
MSGGSKESAFPRLAAVLAIRAAGDSKEILMSNNHKDPQTETLAETENYVVWKADEPDGETTYHVELNNVTVHFFKEEWDEFLELARILK